MRKWVKRAGIALAVLVMSAGVALASAWWWLRVAPIDADARTARALFTRVLNGEPELGPEAIGSLVGALEREPEDAQLWLWLGLANMHEYLRTHERVHAIRASMAFDRAVELDPRDTSAAGWRAFFAYKAAQSRGLDLEEPRRALLEASGRDPRFTPFLAAVTLAPLPLSSGVPQAVLRDLEAIEDCGDGTSHSCRVAPLHPHGAEGYHATLGDLRLRVGDLEGARRAYARALEMEGAARWPYREAFEAWVEEAPARLARLTDEDADAQVPIFFATGERACASCHVR